jgi:heme/copper-type cytochrome/quinol oxidase subunit 2
MKTARWLAPFFVLALALLLLPAGGAAKPQTRQIALDATQFQFTPGRIEVNQGDQIVITLTASDVVHGFYLDGYGIEQRVEPGVPQQITFVDDQAGQFRYRCAVSCGPLHPFMIGELVVTPNAPFWRAAGLILVATAGMLTYLWQSKGKRYEQTQA